MPTTISRFRILAPLYELNRATVVVPTQGGDVKLRFKITISGQAQAEFHGHWMVEGDDLGALHNTIVEVEFPSLLSIRPELRPGRPSGPPDLQKNAVKLLNLVLEHYRRAVPAPQIRSVALKHASGFHYIARDDAGQAREGDFMTGMGLRSDGEDAGLDDGNHEAIDEVQRGVRLGEIPTYLSLYLDSLAERAAGNYRSALAHLYMSFEMLSTMTCWIIGAKRAGREQVREFLEPSSNERPSIYAVVKQTRKWAGAGPTSTQLMKQLSRLWKHRNDVMHGNRVPIEVRDIEKAYESSAFLASWLESAVDGVERL